MYRITSDERCCRGRKKGGGSSAPSFQRSDRGLVAARDKKGTMVCLCPNYSNGAAMGDELRTSLCRGNELLENEGPFRVPFGAFVLGQLLA